MLKCRDGIIHLKQIPGGICAGVREEKAPEEGFGALHAELIERTFLPGYMADHHNPYEVKGRTTEQLKNHEMGGR